MVKIINLTQHKPTLEQEEAGVMQPVDGVKELLTFTKLPDTTELWLRAKQLADKAKSICKSWDESSQGPVPWKVLIGGAPYFMRALEETLIDYDFTPVYSFSQRCSEETTLPDGRVRKVGEFFHLGFVEVE